MLDELGLTKDFVQSSFGVKTLSVKVDEKNYLDVEDQKRIRRRLKQYSNFIIARFDQGYAPYTIAQLLGVSEESIRSRLRKAGLFNSEGPGRPKKHRNSSNNL